MNSRTGLTEFVFYMLCFYVEIMYKTPVLVYDVTRFRVTERSSFIAAVLRRCLIVVRKMYGLCE